MEKRKEKSGKGREGKKAGSLEGFSTQK